MQWSDFYSYEYDDDVDNDHDYIDDKDDYHDYNGDDDDAGAKTRYDICGIPPALISPQFGWKQPIINCTPNPTFLQSPKYGNKNTKANMIANRNTEQNLQQNINFKKQSMINDLSFKLFCWPSKYLPNKDSGLNQS